MGAEEACESPPMRASSQLCSPKRPRRLTPPLAMPKFIWNVFSLRFGTLRSRSSVTETAARYTFGNAIAVFSVGIKSSSEKSPSPVLNALVRRDMTEAALALTRGLKYENAGTVEFIYDPETENFFFIEMNTRIQVEHPVTEMLYGKDLVVEQFRVAQGQRLSFATPAQSDGRSAIEFRINAEDSAREFRPAPGTLTRWRPPSGPDLRLDTHVYETYRIPPYYNSMLAKLIVTGRSAGKALSVESWR